MRSTCAGRSAGQWAQSPWESVGGGRAVPPQPSHVPLEPSTEGADPQHPSCRQAVLSGPWLGSHLSTGVAQGDSINPQGGGGDHQG